MCVSAHTEARHLFTVIFLPACRLLREDKVKGQSFLLVSVLFNDNHAVIFYYLPRWKKLCVLGRTLFDPCTQNFYSSSFRSCP